MHLFSLLSNEAVAWNPWGKWAVYIDSKLIYKITNKGQAFSFNQCWLEVCVNVHLHPNRSLKGNFNQGWLYLLIPQNRHFRIGHRLTWIMELSSGYSSYFLLATFTNDWNFQFSLLQCELPSQSAIQRAQWINKSPMYWPGAISKTP